MTDWDERFMTLALHVSTWSKDPKCSVGAIITDSQRRVVGLGYNGFPRGVSDDVARYADKYVKEKLVVHAEANAILNAARVSGCAIYTTKFPCSECAKLIAQSDIATIVCPPRPLGATLDAEDANFASVILHEAGVMLIEGGRE